MATRTLINRLRQTMRELRTANSANVTVTFALATIPMVGFVGAAVDFSHASSVKAAMQAASDSTALMLSKVASGMNKSQLQSKADEYFKTLFTRNEATGIEVTVKYNTNPSQIFVQASSQVKTNFMGLMGIPSMKINVDSQVKWGNSRLRIGLALDNTGSMAQDGKMDALKTATKSLLNQLKGISSSNGDVLVSIVPFGREVNVGPSNYKANWIDWTEWNANNGTCSKSGWGTNMMLGCTLNLGLWTPGDHKNWNGCVSDRGLPLLPSPLNTDINVLGINLSILDTMYTAVQSPSCPEQVTTLTSDWTALNSAVDAMIPVGNTNQAIGLQHAWMSLTGGGPYPQPPAEDPRYKYQKVIILLTDGLNTQNRWYSNQSQIDSRQKMACDNAKTAGITIYTVQVNTGGDPTQSVLQYCASGTDKFTEIKQANQLVATFNSIGTALSNLRIAQ